MSEILLEHTDERGVTTLTLNRPDVHNAFNDRVIAELGDALARLDADDAVRAVVLTGADPSFSAGADLHWMRSMAQADEDENRRDALGLAALLRRLNFLSKPTIARVNGAAFGGGVGLIAACDMALAAGHAKLGLTEVKLGLTPAVISPYVVAAMGERNARRYFLNAEVFSADDAIGLGLVHETVPGEELDEAVNRQVHFLLKGGPQAQAECKRLIQTVSGRTIAEQERLDHFTADMIARLRVSAEGQEGIGAFLDKRRAQWAPGKES